MLPSDYMQTSFGKYNNKLYNENLVMDIISQEEKRQNLMGNTTFATSLNIWNKRPLIYFQIEYDQLNTFQSSCKQINDDYFMVIVRSAENKIIIGKIRLRGMEPTWFLPLDVDFEEYANSAIVMVGKYMVVQVANPFFKHCNYFKIDPETKEVEKLTIEGKFTRIASIDDNLVLLGQQAYLIYAIEHK